MNTQLNIKTLLGKGQEWLYKELQYLEGVQSHHPTDVITQDRITLVKWIINAHYSEGGE